MKETVAVTAERVRILYSKAFVSITTALVAAIVFVYIFREQIALPVLLAWLGFMFVMTLGRYWLLFDYEKHNKDVQNHQGFENRFIYSTGLVGVGWAFFIMQGVLLPTFEYRIYSLLLLVAIIAVAAPIFSSSIKTVYAYIAPPLIVTIPFLFAQGGDDVALAIALIIFVVVVVRSSNSIYDTLTESFSSRLQAQGLAKNLEQLRHEKLADDRRMQGIMDFSPAAIYVKDLEGHFTFLNKKVADLHGMRRKEILGKTLYDILPEDIADTINENDVKVIEAGEPLKYEESAPQDDGLHHYVSIKFPLFDEHGKIYSVGGISTDITERFNIEESLRISQQRLLLYREQSPLGVIEWNTDFEFLDWNPASEKIFGFTKEEVIGRNITERILPESARPAVDKIWSELIANQGGTYSLNENITKDGRTILCEWNNTPLVDHAGKVIGVTSLVEDVTDRQRNEDALLRSQKMDAIGKLTGGIAHDFNNMLGVILGFSQLLKKSISEDDTKMTRYADEIYNAGERAKKLTSKLLEFTHKAPSFEQTTQVNELLQGMQHMLEKTLTLSLQLELGEGLWPVWIDKSRLEDAVLNICINSMHAMPDGGELILNSRNISLSDSDVQNSELAAGDYVLLSISDTGVGMSREVQQKMFDPFFTTKGDGGTGLGMSQVYGFVQQSSGKIQVYSEPGRGTRVVIYLPRQLDAEIAGEVSVAANLEELPTGDETILLVDDEVALLDLNEEILSSHGYTVLCAESAEQALEVLKDTSIDLLVSDVVMPGMDGYQLATEVMERYPEIKIQIVSGFSDGRKVNLVDESLHQKRLLKPVTTEMLLGRIRALLDEQ